MTEERWQEARDRIEEKFSVFGKGTEEKDDERVEWIEFSAPGAKKMRLEWHDHPKKIGERTISSKRIGSSVTIEPEYSDTERSQFVVLLTWNDGLGDWEESGEASQLF